MSLEEQANEQKTAFNAAMTNFEIARRGANSSRDYFVIAMRGEEVTHAANVLSKTLEELEKQWQPRQKNSPKGYWIFITQDGLTAKVKSLATNASAKIAKRGTK